MAASRQATPSPSGDPGLLIDGRFRIQPAVSLGLLGGHASFAAEDGRGIAGDVVALRLQAGVPARPRLPAFMKIRHEALLAPMAYGAAGGACWIITSAPPGPVLASLSVPWSGNALLTHVLRPAARALDALQTDGLTHRAIRPDNVFVAAGTHRMGHGVVLGPCWASPAAVGQPAMFEPPYSAVCPPSARGDGGIADDVYALGVLLLALCTRTVPLEGLSAREIVHLKLEYGSYASLAGQTRLPRGFEEILRAMLADDPLARPTPASLASLEGIHLRRGGQRSTLRAARPIMVGDQAVWNPRMLAISCAEQPAQAMRLLRQGAIEQWLRRNTEDAMLAATIEELRREDLLTDARASAAHASAVKTSPAAMRVNDTSLMRLVALLDPLAPLFWRGTWLWPDGIGPMLAASLIQPPLMASQEAAALLDQLVLRGGIARWWQLRPTRPEQSGSTPLTALRAAGQGDPHSVLLHVTYALNPYLPCASPRLVEQPVLDPAALLGAIEQLGGSPLLDTHGLAFLAARLEEPVPDSAILAAADRQTMRELRILGSCQTATACGPLPRIASELLPRLETVLRDWPGVSRRQRHLTTLRGMATVGDLAGMLSLLGDPSVREQDESARAQALQEVDRLRALLTEQTEQMPRRLELSRQAARDTASAIGVVCLIAMLLLELRV